MTARKQLSAVSDQVGAGSAGRKSEYRLAGGASLTLDFSGHGRADPDELYRILWAALKPGETMPASKPNVHIH